LKQRRSPQVSLSLSGAAERQAVPRQQSNPGGISMMTKPRAHVALLLALAGSASVAAPPLPPVLSDLAAPIEASVQLPGSGVQMLELADRVVYIAGNGRYVFTGAAWDLWHGEPLDSVAQATALAARVNLERLALDPVELGAFTLGMVAADAQTGQQGRAPLWVFVDPRCADCRALLKALDASGDLAHVVVLPIGGEDSLEAATRLRCAPSAETAWSALLEQSWSQLPEQTADCDTQSLVRALITARLLGIDTVPTLIAPDGRLQRGSPADLSAWLAGA
jgi:thiol:disulfide interchange protein DsbC